MQTTAYWHQSNSKISLNNRVSSKSGASQSDRSPSPDIVWNRIPESKRNDVIEYALEYEALSPRELAIKYTDEKRFLSLNLQYTVF